MMTKRKLPQRGGTYRREKNGDLIRVHPPVAKPAPAPEPPTNSDEKE